MHINQSLGIWFSTLWNARHYGKCFTILSGSGQSPASILFLRGNHLLLSQLPGEHTVVLPHTVHSTFKPFAIMNSFLTYSERVRNPVVGYESNSSQVVFNVHQSHTHDSTHPSLFTKLGTTHRHGWSSHLA